MGNAVIYSYIYTDAIPRSYYTRFTPADGPVWLDNVRCIGNESRLLNCTHNGIGVISSYSACFTSNNYFYAAGVQCLGNNHVVATLKIVILLL